MEFFKAQKIANRIVEILTPHVDVIHIAGSVRRRKPEVKDIEVCCIPKKHPTDLFNTSDLVIDAGFNDAVKLIAEKVIKGKSSGRYMQMQLKGKEEINLDLFMPQTDDYYRQYAIRTGSADYSAKVIATAWVNKGWCGTEEGLRLQQDCCKAASGWKIINKNPQKPPVWNSEEEFFEWIGVQWIEAWLRNV
jgi:DNA polymerase/3'-5' exonuclease PolX